jgi:hypothetical protein
MNNERLSTQWWILNFHKTINKYSKPNTPTKIEENRRENLNGPYAGHDIKKIPKLFSSNNLKVACKTIDMKNLRCKKQNTDTYINSGIYKLKSPDCSKKYVGQTWWNFPWSSTKHINDIRRNTTKSGYSQHILENWRQYGCITCKLKRKIS